MHLKEFGSILISTIVSLAILSLLAASLFQLAYSTSRINTSYIKARNKIKKTIITNI